MTTFYTFTKDSEPDSPPIVAADHEDRVYFFVANTKLWHHSARLEVQLDTNHADWTATEVPAEEVPALVEGVKKMDGRGHSGRYLRDLKSQPPEDKRTSAELGLLTTARDRPATGEGVRGLLEGLARGQSREVARYAVARKAVAQNLAYELNNDMKKSLTGIPLRAKAATVGAHVVVRVEKGPASRKRTTSRSGAKVAGAGSHGVVKIEKGYGPRKRTASRTGLKTA
ncbi:hypothetical protein ACTXL6_16405 [Brachybacterium tyrofermentans]|uniref:hypothetical protein n=1 Tax=Brachybacterium tyrofermentans TaxID=47848 RepID=UPI003FD4A0EC